MVFITCPLRYVLSGVIGTEQNSTSRSLSSSIVSNAISNGLIDSNETPRLLFYIFHQMNKAFCGCRLVVSVVVLSFNCD